ncbi:MAG: DDE-type integrase/transposase/recombinase [Pseudomonadota bacterium]|nr:DDE-type integrase/transposase/recombinase [Pseudomonadota bacterium]
MIAIHSIIECIRLIYLTNWSYREIADYVGISHQSVARYIEKCSNLGVDWQDIKNKSPDEVLTLLGIQAAALRLSGKIHMDYEEAAKSISRGRKGSNKRSILIDQHMAKFGDKAVGHSACYKGIRAAMKKLELSIKQVFEPGRAMHIDFAGKILELKSGITLYFFIAVWAYSKFTVIRAYSNQKQSSWMKGINSAIQKSGITPIFVVSDNASPLVKIKDGHRSITDGYQQIIAHYDFVADFIPPGKPLYNQPAEQGVKIFTEEIYPKLAQLDLGTEEEANDALDMFMEEFNNRHLSGRKVSRFELLDSDEKPVARPCNSNEFEPDVVVKKVSIGKHYSFKVDGVFYSVPQECYWKKVTLEIHKQKIVVKLGNKLVWVHQRLPKDSEHVILPEHMPEKHRKLLAQNKQYFVSWAEGKDENLARMMIAQYEDKGLSDTDFYARRQCLEIKRLFEEYDEEGLGGEFVTMCFICLESDRANITSLKKLLHGKVYENDDYLDAFDAFYAAKQAKLSGATNYVH